MNSKDEIIPKSDVSPKVEKVDKADKPSKSDKVQMEKDGVIVLVEIPAVESKKGEGFVVVGMVDADEKVIATLVATPAHTFMTSEGYLKVIPENFNLVNVPKVS